MFICMLVLEFVGLAVGLAVGLGDAGTITFVLALLFVFSVVLQPALRTTIASKLTKLLLLRISGPPMYEKRCFTYLQGP